MCVLADNEVPKTAGVSIQTTQHVVLQINISTNNLTLEHLANHKYFYAVHVSAPSVTLNHLDCQNREVHGGGLVHIQAQNVEMEGLKLENCDIHRGRIA